MTKKIRTSISLALISCSDLLLRSPTPIATSNPPLLINGLLMNGLLINRLLTKACLMWQLIVEIQFGDPTKH